MPAIGAILKQPVTGAIYFFDGGALLVGSRENGEAVAAGGFLTPFGFLGSRPLRI
jgi:hypothetical protein